VLAGEAPVEGDGGGVVARGEGVQARLHGGEVGAVVRREHLALDDRAVELDLVEPGGVGGQVDENERGVAGRERADGLLPALAAALGSVDDYLSQMHILAK